MKRQIRTGVFETNSSSTHSLTVYKKSDWDEFKKGEKLLDDWKNRCFTKTELRNSKEFIDFVEDNYDEEDVKNFNKEDWDNALQDYMEEECLYDYDSYCEYYEVLEEEIKDSEYVAVSIFRENY